jgi:hypothetical protein
MLAFLIALVVQVVPATGRDGLTVAERRHRDAILREMGEPDLPAWGGSYSNPPWVTCYLAPRAGFIHIVGSDLGPIVSYAAVRASGNRLELTFEERPEAPVVYWSVPWGVRRYLIAEFRMHEFCALVNAGDEPRGNGEEGWPLVHPADLNRTVSGKPQVPQAWKELLLDAPIEARILRIDRRAVRAVRRYGRERETRVFLHVGTASGVRRDLGFFLGRGRRPLVGYVERVDRTACIVLLTEYYEDDSDRLRIGDYAGTVRAR